MATIGQRLREAREHAGITQRALAPRLGVTFGLVSRWEAGDRTPAFEELVKIAEILGIDARELLRDVDDVTVRLSDVQLIKLVQAYTQFTPFFKKRFLEFADHFADISREAETQGHPVIPETSGTT